MSHDDALRDDLLRMFAEDQKTWGAVLALVNEDEAFAKDFQRKFDERGGWDMAAIADWPDAPDVVAAYQVSTATTASVFGRLSPRRVGRHGRALARTELTLHGCLCSTLATSTSNSSAWSFCSSFRAANATSSTTRSRSTCSARSDPNFPGSGLWDCP